MTGQHCIMEEGDREEINITAVIFLLQLIFWGNIFITKAASPFYFPSIIH